MCLAYIPCEAHTIQLVIKDALEQAVEFDDVSNKAARLTRISKQSIVIAEELAILEKK